MRLRTLLLALTVACTGCVDPSSGSDPMPPPEPPQLPGAACDLPRFPSPGVRIRTANTPLIGPMTGAFVAHADGLGGVFETDETDGRTVALVDDAGLLDASALAEDPDLTVWAHSAVNESEDNQYGAFFAGDGSLLVQTWDSYLPDAPEDTPDGGFNLSAPAESECPWIPDPAECREEIRPFPVLVRRGEEQIWLYQGESGEVDGVTVHIQIAEEGRGMGAFYDKCGASRYANVLILGD